MPKERKSESGMDELPATTHGQYDLLELPLLMFITRGRTLLCLGFHSLSSSKFDCSYLMRNRSDYSRLQPLPLDIKEGNAPEGEFQEYDGFRYPFEYIHASRAGKACVCILPCE